MMVTYWHLALFLLVLALEGSLVKAKNKIRSRKHYQAILETKDYVPQSLRFAMKEYNNANKDNYIYNVTHILQVQEKITRGMYYLITAEIGQTICKNPRTDPLQCLLQKNPKEKKLQTHSFEVFTIP